MLSNVNLYFNNPSAYYKIENIKKKSAGYNLIEFYFNLLKLCAHLTM